MAVIVFKKIPVLKSVNPKSSPAIQQMDVKRKLIEERLQRQLKERGIKLYAFLKPMFSRLGLAIRRGYQSLIDAEEKYRHKVLKSSFKDNVLKEQKISELLQTAESLVLEEKYNEAEQAYIEALTIDDKDYDAYKGLAKMYMLNKDYKHAKETFEFLMNLNQDDPFIYRSLGEIAANKGDLKTAEDGYLKSLELDNKEITSYLDLAEVYLHLDEPQKSFEILSQAAALEPRNPKVLDFLIEISIILEDKVAARKAYHQLQESNPENKKLKEFKERIEKL
ncbi:tetratricopeptide repeat protein [bacterium]|jgi:predicted Zn-dependent protease|nr:tetratricopeptide repeat protein [bacterium]MBT5401348.1 tetratricopeptide repeat protein [bacterium]MBT6067452.1 tetratricopeptide repeat protein [bacterium]